MPRSPRDFQPDAAYHLISRFVDREWFIQRESERDHYLRLVGRALQRSDWRLMAFAVMSNHIHLAVVAGRHPLDSWIRGVHSTFADTMNRAYDRIGGMFVRGPKAKFVEPQAVGSLIAYIHNNPVRAGLCASASGSRWTSHRAYVGRAIRPPWLDVAEGMRRAGFADCSGFDAWVGDPARAEAERVHVDAVETDEETQHSESRCLDKREAEPMVIVEATASMLGISIARLCSAARGPEEVRGRALAVRVATTFGLTGQTIAAALQISQQRASVLRRLDASAVDTELCNRIIDAVATTASVGKA